MLLDSINCYFENYYKRHNGSFVTAMTITCVARSRISGCPTLAAQYSQSQLLLLDFGSSLLADIQFTGYLTSYNALR